MALSCYCDIDGAEWYYTPANDFVPFPVGKRKRCCSCKEFINILEPSIELFRIGYDDNGDEKELASWFLCEECSEIYLNLDAAGYCYYAGDDLRENLRDYWDVTGFEPKKSA